MVTSKNLRNLYNYGFDVVDFYVSIYSKIDEYMISGNEEKLKSIWKNLGKKIKERENG